MQKSGRIWALIAATIVLVLSIGCSLALTGCGSAEDKARESGDWSGVIAAKVNDKTEITEQQVNDYVARYRAYSGLEEDTAWANWLAKNGLTAEDVRENVILTYVQRAVVNEYAEKDELSITDEYIDEYLENLKTQYGIDTEDPEAWTEFLEGIGYTEETYIEDVRAGMLQEEVQNAEVDYPTPTTAELQAEVDSDPSAWIGKESYNILFSVDEDGANDAEALAAAQSAIDTLKSSGTLTEETVDELGQQLVSDGTASQASNVGFDCATTFVTEYQNALDGLAIGEITATPVKSEYGYHVIYCISETTLNSAGKINVNDLPSSLFSSLNQTVAYSLYSTAQEEWLQEEVDKAKVTINKMPEGLPYDIEPQLSTSTNTNTNANSNASANVNAASNENANDAVKE